MMDEMVTTRLHSGKTREQAGSVSDNGRALAYASGSFPGLYNDGMLIVVWIVFLLVMLFLLGSAVGSFLNVCIVRLPQGRSLVRPASCCGQCGKPIRWQDNIPLLSYWLLRGRCRACGAPFSMRYFWIELLTGVVFVLIYFLEIGRNIHHFQLLTWYETDYEYLLVEMFRPRPWLVFGFHAMLASSLIVATMSNYEQHTVPRSVTVWGVLLGLLAAVLFPWPWPDETAHAITTYAGGQVIFGREQKPYTWGPRIGAMPSEAPWWQGDVTPRAGFYLWPVWGPLPDWLPPGSWRLGVATGLAGILAGAILMGLVRVAFNLGTGAELIGWGETSLLMIAGGFVGWQPVVVAGMIGLVPGMIGATRQAATKSEWPIAYSMWPALAVIGVLLGWYWIGPLVQGLFFNETRVLLLVTVYVATLAAFSVYLRLAGIARAVPRP
jgi:leader peptidase (prepilin peptidase)/N-methyltransferase